MKKYFSFIPLLFLCACSTGISIQKYNAAPASTASFMLCHGYSCTYKTPTGFSDAEWNKVAAIFKNNPAKNEQEERSKIGRAIALMEQFSGAKTGTSEDEAQATSIKKSALQMDCIDETINTTHYIGFLENAGLLKFYQGTEPTHRGYILDARWPHNTAVIKEKNNPNLWVVDSFYRANGQEPYIVPRADWLAGWRPLGATQ